jgi:hypothetical protein
MPLAEKTTAPNGGKSDPSFRYDLNANEYPARKDLPQIEGTPPGASVIPNS